MIRLDGLRGVAVLAVLLFHTGYFLIPSVRPNLLPGGFIGVDLFFVLSGFLMTRILLDRGQSYRRFYVRRAARILPALYVFLAAQALYAIAIGSGLVPALRADILISTGLGNWGDTLGITLPFGSGQTWSLGVEEQLYLLWPLALILIARRDPRRILWCALAGTVLAMILKLWMFQAGIPGYHIYGQTEVRLDDFLAGAAVAAMWQAGFRPMRHLRPLTLASAGFLAWCLAFAHPYTSAWMYDGGYTLIALAAAVVLYACLHETPETQILAARPLRSAGRFSYAIYLWHPLVFLAAFHALPHHTAARVLWATGLLMAIAVGSTLLIEEPLRRWVARGGAPAWLSPIQSRPAGTGPRLGSDGESVGWSRPGGPSGPTRSRKVGTPQGRVLANGQSR